MFVLFGALNRRVGTLKCHWLLSLLSHSLVLLNVFYGNSNSRSRRAHLNPLATSGPSQRLNFHLQSKSGGSQTWSLHIHYNTATNLVWVQKNTPPPPKKKVKNYTSCRPSQSLHSEILGWGRGVSVHARELLFWRYIRWVLRTQKYWVPSAFQRSLFRRWCRFGGFYVHYNHSRARRQLP